MNSSKTKNAKSNTVNLINELEEDKLLINVKHTCCSQEDLKKMLKECANEYNKSLNYNYSCLTEERYNKILKGINNCRIMSFKEFKIYTE